MANYRNYSLTDYCAALSGRNPVPGGGSAAAYAAALGASLLLMVANYSISDKTPPDLVEETKRLLAKTQKLRDRLLELVDLDAQAYLKVVESKKGTVQSKENALKGAREVPREVCQLCYEAIELTPFLVEKGNKFLLSDIEVAVELLEAAFNSAKINIETNQ